jgi:capsular polysaccharide biosynthesis protein
MSFTNGHSSLSGQQKSSASNSNGMPIEPLPTELANSRTHQLPDDPPTVATRPVNPRDYEDTASSANGGFIDETNTQVVQALLGRIRELETALSLPSNQVSPSTGYIDIVQFLRILVSHLVLIVVVAVLGTLLAYVVVSNQKPIFQTETSLVVIPNINESAIPRPIQQIEVALGTYVQVLRSQNLIRQVETKLSETYDAADLAQVDTEVRPVENSSIIAVTVQSSDPALAQAYAQAMTDIVLTDNPLPLFEMSYRMDVLDSPDLPMQPSFPDKKISLALGAIASVILGVVVAFFVDTYVSQRRTGRQPLRGAA